MRISDWEFFVKKTLPGGGDIRFEGPIVRRKIPVFAGILAWNWEGDGFSAILAENLGISRP